MNRDHRASIAQETLTILKRGAYVTSAGYHIDIAQNLADAVQRTRLYRPADFPDALPLAPSAFNGETKIEVTSETTLEAVRRVTMETFRHKSLYAHRSKQNRSSKGAQAVCALAA